MKKIVSVLLAAAVAISIITIVPFSAGAAEVDPVIGAENEAQAETTLPYETAAETTAADKANDALLGAEAFENAEALAEPAENTDNGSEAIEKPAAPALSVANTVSGLSAVWSAVGNAEYYRVYYKTASDEEWSSFDTVETSCYIPDAGSGKLYYVQVQPFGAQDTEGHYSQVKSMTYISRAEITSLSFNGSANVLIYNSAGEANKYQIAKKRIGDKAYTYYTTTSSSFTDKNVVTANTYCYQVRAMYATAKNGTAYGAWSATKTVVTLARTNVSLANRSNGIRAQWNAVSGASRYAVYFKSADDENWSTASTTNTFYPLLNVKSGALYFVQVRPVAGNVSGAYSWVKSLTFIGRSYVTASNGAEGIKISCGNIEGANRYQIAKKKAGASAYSYYISDEPAYLDTDVAGNTQYIYQARAMYATENSGTAYGEWSASKSILRLTAPAVSLSNKSNGMRVDWSKVPGAVKYTVYIKAASASSWQSATTTNTYYPMLTVKSGVLYYVQVRPLGNGVNGPFSEPKSLTFIGQVNPQMSLTGEGLKYSWRAVEGANKYQIAKKKKSDPAYEFFTTAELSYTDEAVKNSKEHYVYQVRAMYETEDSGTAYGEWSAVYNFVNGKIPNGYQISNGYRYYYKNGVLQRNGIVGTKSEGYYYADANGICCTSEEMRLAAEFVMNCGTGKTADERMRSSFKYLAEKFPYKRTYDHPQSKSDIPPLAIDMFKNKRGNCYRYAACFTCIAKICGYRARTAAGNTGNGSPHGWTEVYMDGKWYYFDPDMQLPGWGFPDFAAYKMSTHPWNVKARFKTEVTISNGKAVWN